MQDIGKIHANPFTLQLRNVGFCSIFLCLFEQFRWRILHIKCIEMCLLYFILCQLDVVQFTLGYPQKCNFIIFPLESSLKQQGSIFYRHFQNRGHFLHLKLPPSWGISATGSGKTLAYLLPSFSALGIGNFLPFLLIPWRHNQFLNVTKTWNLDFENAGIHQSQTWVENWWTSYFAPVCVFLF